MGKPKEETSDSSNSEKKVTTGMTGTTGTTCSTAQTGTGTKATTGSQSSPESKPSPGSKSKDHVKGKDPRETKDKTEKKEHKEESSEKESKESEEKAALKAPNKKRTEAERRHDREKVEKITKKMEEQKEQDKQDARKQAKEEEEKFLKVRAAQVLDQYKPKSKAAQLRSSDDKFPVNHAKKMAKLVKENNFGAIKSMYLAIRPNGKYATWPGKEHDDERKKEKFVTMDLRVRLAQDKDKAAKEPPKEKKPGKKPNGKNKHITEQELADLPVLPYIGPHDPVPQRPPSPPRPTRHEKDLIDANGEPYWKTEAETLSTESKSETDEIDKDIVNEESFIANATTAQDLEKCQPEGRLKFRDDEKRYHHYSDIKDDVLEVDHYFKKERFHAQLPGEDKDKRGPVFYNSVLQILETYQPYPWKTWDKDTRPMANFANTMTVFRYQRGVENIHGHEEEMRKSAVKQGFVDILKQDDTEDK